MYVHDIHQKVCIHFLVDVLNCIHFTVRLMVEEFRSPNNSQHRLYCDMCIASMSIQDLFAVQQLVSPYESHEFQRLLDAC